MNIIGRLSTITYYVCSVPNITIFYIEFCTFQINSIDPVHGKNHAILKITDRCFIWLPRRRSTGKVYIGPFKCMHMIFNCTSRRLTFHCLTLTFYLISSHQNEIAVAVTVLLRPYCSSLRAHYTEYEFIRNL